MTAFCWGVATAAYQIEGGWDADGKGPSVWDTLAHRPGGLAGATGDVACDHYHRVEEDLDLLAGLGVTSYRFSVSWPRVQPGGTGAVNGPGLAFYDRLVDGLVALGIEPTVTLYHWDHPQELEDAGGWTTPAIADRFADYAGIVAGRLGDRVTRWITLNEPQSVVVGNILGFSRPAGPLGADGIAIAHNLLLAHGSALARLREVTSAPVGIAINVSGVEPASDSAVDLAAARRAEVYEDRLFLDPILTGSYPVLEGRDGVGSLEGGLVEGRRVEGGRVEGGPIIDASAEDMAVISAPIDFLGVNWYAPARVGGLAVARGGDVGDQPPAGGLLDGLLGGLRDMWGYDRVPIPGAPTNMLGGPIDPAGLGRVLAQLAARYPRLPPIYITENGLPLLEADTVAPDVGDHDAPRIDYLEKCIGEVKRAIANGVDVRGYFVWSLMDNLEWGLGFAPRFGLVHVDFETQTRTPKDSYRWYRDVIRGG